MWGTYFEKVSEAGLVKVEEGEGAVLGLALLVSRCSSDI